MVFFLKEPSENFLSIWKLQKALYSWRTPKIFVPETPLEGLLLLRPSEGILTI